MTQHSELVASMIKTPGKFFDHPRHVASYPGLQRSDRIDILRSWKHDVILLMKAAEENMAGDSSYNLEDINTALRNEGSPED